MQKNILKNLVIAIAFIFFLPLTVFAATPTQQLAAILNNLQGMQAQFAQTVQDGHGQIMQQSSGTMALSRPGKFRWDTRNPSHQLLIADGQKLWFYDEELQQVTVQNQHAVHTGSPAMLLEGSAISLTQDFTVNTVTGNDNKQTFKLTPRKKDTLFNTVYLSFKQNQLQQMRLIDNLGQETLINFSRVIVNPPLNNTVFRFITPKGVEVVNQ